jgi:hypothetical protein
MATTFTHKCYAAECPYVLPANLLMCKRHWFLVPQGIRNRVWALYRAGKEGTVEHRAACQAAREAVARITGKDVSKP